jgi:hypothetical protein
VPRSFSLVLVVCLDVVAACSAPSSTTAAEPDAAAPVVEPDAPAVVDDSPLDIYALGVQGFVLRRGNDVVMTAPLFTRQSAIEVTFNAALSADTAAIDAGLAGEPLADVRAIISGHAHYDHFMDVPHILAKAPNATQGATTSAPVASTAPRRKGIRRARCIQPRRPSATIATIETTAPAVADIGRNVSFTSCAPSGRSTARSPSSDVTAPTDERHPGCQFWFTSKRVPRTSEA